MKGRLWLFLPLALFSLSGLMCPRVSAAEPAAGESERIRAIVKEVLREYAATLGDKQASPATKEIMRNLVQDNAQVLKDTEKALKLRDDHAEALFLGGVVKGELFKEDAGLDDIRRALALKPEIPGGRMSAAILLYEMERFEEAIAGFTEVLAKDTASADLRDAHYYRGDSHYNLKRKDEACRDWRASAKLGDKDAVFIVKNYCDTDQEKIPKKPQRKRRKTVVSF